MVSMKRADAHTDPETSQSTTMRPLRSGLCRNLSASGMPWVRVALRRVRLISGTPRERAAWRRLTTSRSLRTSRAITSRKRMISPGERLAKGVRPSAP